MAGLFSEEGKKSSGSSLKEKCSTPFCVRLILNSMKQRKPENFLGGNCDRLSSIRIEQMKHKVFTLMLVLFATLCPAEERSQEEVAYYAGWVGCKPPPIYLDQSDRTNYAEASYKGKRVLLYSFDAGNFVDSANLPRLTLELQALQHARTNSATGFVVIGFTRGLLWSPCLGTTNLPKEIDAVSRFPIVNLNNKRHENALGEPYELLMSPGGILIGTNGIICSVFSKNMTEQDFKSLDSFPEWQGPQRSPLERKTDGKK